MFCCQYFPIAMLGPSKTMTLAAENVTRIAYRHVGASNYIGLSVLTSYITAHVLTRLQICNFTFCL